MHVMGGARGVSAMLNVTKHAVIVIKIESAYRRIKVGTTF